MLSKAIRLSAVLALLMLAACEPRGESKSLTGILQSSLEKYRTTLADTTVPDEVQTTLNTLTDTLRSVAEKQDISKSEKEMDAIVESLTSLLGHAGYTSRPAMAALRDQFLQYKSKDYYSTESLGAFRLLVARTFFLLSSELEGVRFQLGERERKV